jgi:glycerol-1-phosphate dehydrogenase [NAD(P)+]
MIAELGSIVGLEGLSKYLDEVLQERPHPIGIRYLDISDGALDRLPEVIEGLGVEPGVAEVSVLTDGVPKLRRGDDATELVERLIGSRWRVRRIQIDPVQDRVHADRDTVTRAQLAATGSSGLVTVGSGTMCDIGKLVSAGLDGTPHVEVQTALSVNGFADNQSVLLVDGVKRTVPSRWPDALLADTALLAEAPVALNLAGVGDLSAMFTAPADWLIACRLGLGEGYCAGLVALVRDHGDTLLATAPGLRQGSPEAVDLVARLLTLSGVSMGLAGDTAIASGTEHAISHLVDMAMVKQGVEPAFHGAQVGAASVLASLVWRHVLGQLAAPEGRTWRLPSRSAMEATVRGAFSEVDPSGTMGESCWRLYRRKLGRMDALWPKLETYDWPRLARDAEALASDPAELACSLRRAGVPVRFSELDTPIDPATVRWALTSCHLLRDRFGIVDLAVLLSAWGPDDVESILDQAKVLGAGL